MMLFNMMVRLLAAVALAGLWVGPAVSMDVSHIINPPAREPAVISASYKKASDENPDHDALSISVVGSKVLPRSVVNTKELKKIFTIAYTNNESRVLSQPLNYYELPDGEWLKRDFRSVKNDNVGTQSQVKGLSSVPLFTDYTLNAQKDKTVTNIPVDVEKCVQNKDNVVNEFLFELEDITNAMVDTIYFFGTILKNQIETLGSNGLKFGNTIRFDFFFVLIFLGCFCIAILLFIYYRILPSLLHKRGLFDSEEGEIQ